MRIIFIASLLILLSACKKKEKWDKDTLVNDCLHNFTKKNEQQKLFTTMQIAHICDCMTEKMLVKYSSAKAADKDEDGIQQLARVCAQEVMEKVKY